MREKIHSLKKRASRIHEKLTHSQKAALSASIPFFGLSIYILLLLSFADFFNYGQHTRMLFVFGALACFLMSYLLYRSVREVDPLDYIAYMLFPYEDKLTPYDASSSLLFFGLVLIATTPIVHSYFSSIFATSTVLLAGGLLVALAVVGYVSHSMES